MEVELQLCHLFLLYAFWGLWTSNGNFCTRGSASPKFHHRRNKCSPFCSLLLFIYKRCKFEVAVYLFFISVLCLFTSCSILKNKIKLARPMKILRIDKPVTIGFILAYIDSLGYSKTPISTSDVCNEITPRVVVYLEKGPTEDRNIDTNNTLDS